MGIYAIFLHNIPVYYNFDDKKKRKIVANIVIPLINADLVLYSCTGKEKHNSANRQNT